jgi:hypothetical protein
LVLALVPVAEPVVAVKATGTPETALPYWSVTLTEGAVATFVFTVAVWLLPALRASVVALPAVPVAVKVTGLPLRLPDVAVRVFAPAAVASFHEPTLAMPLASVLAVVAVALPVRAANVTVTPATGLPNVSATRTDGAVATFVFTVAFWPSPVEAAIPAAAAAVPVAWNVTFARPVVAAVSVFAPAAVASVQEPTAAMPLALVVAVVPVAEPVTALKVTVAPGIPFPKLSATRTAGAVAALALTVAVWPSPALTVIDAGAPTVPVAWKVTDVKPVAVAERLLFPAVVPSCQEPAVAMPLASVV